MYIRILTTILGTNKDIYKSKTCEAALIVYSPMDVRHSRYSLVICLGSLTLFCSHDIGKHICVHGALYA